MKAIKGIKLIILFGSQAKNKTHQRSDFDVAVLGDHPLSLEEKEQVAKITAEKIKVSEDEIDLVDLWDAPPLLQHEVAQNSKLLYGQKFDLIRFQVLAWKRYLDTAKLRRAQEKYLEKFSTY